MPFTSTTIISLRALLLSGYTSISKWTVVNLVPSMPLWSTCRVQVRYRPWSVKVYSRLTQMVQRAGGKFNDKFSPEATIRWTNITDVV